MSDGGDSVQNSARSGEAGDESLDESQQQLQQEQEEEEQQQLDDTTAQPAEEVDADADADEAASPTDAAAAPSSSTGEAAEAEASPDAPSSSDSPSQSTEAQPSPDTEAQTTQQTEEQAPSEVSQKEEEESKEQSPEVANDPVAEKVSTGMQASDMTGDGLNDSNADEEISTSNAGNQAGGSDDQLESLEREDGDEQQQQQNDEDQPMVQVEITILPDGFKHSEVVPLHETVLGLKSVLSERFKLPTEQMRLALGDLVLDDQRELAEYREFEINRMQNMGVSDEEAQAAPLSFVLNIELSESEAAALATSEAEAAAAAAESSYRMPDILKVVINREELELEAEEEEEKELNGEGGTRPATERTPEQVVYVQVIRDNLHYPKPFLGGFRHKYYGTIYHHASSQTARKKKKMEVVKFHRETQTIQIISRSQQTNREAGTQMERRDLLLDHSNDHVIMSKPYFTADELEALRDLKAREIQCFLRQCFAWRRVRRLREAKADKVEAEMKARALKAKLEAEEHARQIQRRMHPRTKEDFAVLFAELEAWRLHETQRIKESGLGSEEIAAALQELLNKEVKLLQTIDRLKITAAKENKWTRTQTNLEKMASPKEWSSREGDLIEVETPFTTRAKELVDLYNGLCLRNLSRAQRVDVLLHIKYTVKEFDCELSRDIVELIKREEDLLRRQRSEASLEGCRKRLQNLFLQFVNTPAFNPEASNFARVPPDNAKPPPPIALSSSLAKPAMFTKTNTITVASNVAGRIFANKQ